MPDENTPFELPETLPTGRTELETLEAQATAAFEARYDQGASTPEDLQELQDLAGAVRAVREALAQASDQPDEPDAEPDAEPAPEPGDELAPEPEPAPEPSAEPAAPSAASAVLDALLLQPKPEPQAQPAPPAGQQAPAQAPADPAPVSAQQQAAPSPAPTSIAASANDYPEDFQMAIASPDPVVIVASADIPGIPAASTLEGMAGLVAAVSAKARSVPNMPGSQHPVASIQKPLSPDRNLDGLSEKDQFERMGDLSSPEFLTASGGWCAPSETIYSFACEVEAPPDAVVLPTFGTSRGGVRFPISPTFRDFNALENNGLFTWTEANDIAAAESGGPTKPCFHIPCVTFDEARLELEGLCVTAGNLTDRAYPELIRRYLSLVLTAHLHRMNTMKIQKMLALVDDVVVLAGTFGAASALLAGLELQVQDLRDQFSMSENALIEAMLPRWTRGVIRADVARRENTDLETVSNADIRSYLQDAGISLQFVSNWQHLGDPDSPATVWPGAVQALLWLPGAYRELTGPTLDIAVARDSVLNSTNDFTVAFTEESYQIYKPGCGSRLVEIPVCPDGASGERVAITCTGGVESP